MTRVATTVIFFFGLFVPVAWAQSLSAEDDVQSWNDLQFTVPLSDRFELYTAATVRVGKNVTRVNDGRFAIGVGWKAHKSLQILPFYWFIRARNAGGNFRNEHRLNLRATYRFPTMGFGLIHRSTFEYRIRTPVRNWRYRAGLTFEKELPKSFIPKAKFYLSDEVFYDSLLNRFSRNRVTIGINKTLSKHLSVDLYYMRQNDGVSRPGDLHVIGTTWRVKK